MPNYRETGRFDPNSAHNRFKEQVGGFDSEKNPYTNDQDNLLLDGFLAYNWAFIATPGRDSFQSKMGRNQEGVKSRLYKIAIHHIEAHAFVPGKRVGRSGTEFTDRDRRVMKWCLSDKGSKNVPITISWIAVLLARDECEILRYLEGKCEQVKGLGLRAGRCPVAKNATNQDRLERLMKNFRTELDNLFKDV